MATHRQGMRRGLPRRVGGDLWPPDRIAPAGVGRGMDTVVESAEMTNESPRATVAASSMGERVDVGISPVAGPAVQINNGLRRGLPRTPGGEPWPPPALVPAVAGAGASVASVDAAVPSAASPGVRRGLPRVQENKPRSVDAIVEQSLTASITGPSTAPATANPLPFTRTAWPGRAVTAPPTARPVPRRLGPFTRGQWVGAVIVGGFGLLFAAAMVVLFVRWLISVESMQDFLITYPGEYHLPESAPVGIPAWLGWQHFFNVFLMVLIIRSGLRVRTEKRPSVHWSPRWNVKRKISLDLWFHQSLDILWVLNGAIFIVLLFVTGQWMKLVPTSWAVFPNALSAALQYLSLDWPTENGWVNYNSLQQLAYFATVFIAAPLAIATGVRMSGIWPKNAKALNRAYPVEWARAIHFPVMLYFIAFIIVHVALVLATGALRNLNHMYASQDVVNWVGFWIFAASLVIIVLGWIAARPLVLAPIAKLFGTVGRG